jgi:SNF2 family DNA or RNA helicase
LLFMQESWRTLENNQMEDRIHRIGSEHHQSIQIIKQITPGTVEEAKIQVLQGKLDRVEEVIRDQEVLARLLGMKGKRRKTDGPED